VRRSRMLPSNGGGRPMSCDRRHTLRAHIKWNTTVGRASREDSREEVRTSSRTYK
jgi:hypothetical protein